MALLVIDDLEKTYDKVTALTGIDLSVEAGEFVTLLGPSGSGKTTLLMSLAGFTTPSKGTIRLDGKDITHVDPEDRNFGFVFQGYALFPHLSVANNIAFSLRVRKWEKPKIAARVAEMLSLVGLDNLAERKPRELSGGQQQRVAIARALAFGPRILLLDEPLSALDRMLRESMQKELKRLHRETGVTFVYVTHDQEEAIAMSDRIAVFNHGRIVEIGLPRDLYKKPSTRFVAGFLGENNFLSGHRADDDETMVEAFGTRFGSAPVKGRRERPGDTLTVWVRPEDIRIGQATDDEIGFRATVVENSFVGALERILLKTATGEQMVATLRSEAAVAAVPGQVIDCRIDPSAIGVLPNETRGS
ncbi:ABC transporter ATP-binding protein [Mesorhizobium mediterraneum]|uniref:Polyamine ABC transporter ATP-binding protein n=1 Tax=Mesorhizobium mediterraneum TaxID=43617 RepID=A0AB36RD80_9HYPH|nr:MULTISPECIES: ABC transporter ATP-binding protein [Mesorhizobium]AZO65518.1 ABC transporter ATP-binding protein [Mesorhizobium sp. M6A.T.Cr.TU.016.01.1.1]PAQ02380.1 polyamine ABC transporter ATP-binding protein [Mesorhizobium mediterraneum]RUU31191.1 ABC transporter ATP-binding protein [Mesorhizobium sp. M6A.T.Ce.TU.002.03.1.1]RWN44370.1 MAG: ABC transporter ATP-binding protein [Mesorhizobium sp.]RWP54191.1 MAG: ABC transporter ATP-binding protein [Mesorhizobium sp.]